MGNRLFVGNLSYNTSEPELRSEFSKFGSVKDLKIIIDRDTGRSKGFGFVQFATEAEAQAALEGLDGQELSGRILAVKVAEERAPRPPGQNRPTMSSASNGFGPPPSNNSYDGENRGRKDKKKRRREDNDWG